MITRPSERARWSQCSGYPAFRALLDSAGELPPSSESLAAWRGTIGHRICEEVLTSGGVMEWHDWALDPSDSVRAVLDFDGGTYVNPNDERIVYTVEQGLIAGVVDCIMAVASAVLDCGPDTQVWIEESVQFSEVLFGTPDVVVWSPSSRRLVIIDYKFGTGVKVEVRGNVQLQTYAVAACRTHKLRPEWVTLCIVQPAKGGVAVSLHDVSEMNVWAERICEELRAVAAPERRLAAGSWCRWCDCAPFCPAQEAAVGAALAYAAVPVQVDASVGRMGQRLREYEDVLSPYATSLREELRRRLEGGLCSPSDAGWQLTEKRAQRKWASEAGVYEWLRLHQVDTEVAQKQVILSPAQLEKAIKGSSLPLPLSELEGLCVRESSGTTLTRVGGARSAAPRLEALGALPAAAISISGQRRFERCG